MNKLLKSVSIISSVIALTLPTTTSFADVNVNRISGGNRYTANINVSRQFEKNFKNNGVAVISSGDDFSYSIMASYLASGIDVPYFITGQDSLDKNISNELKRLNIKEVYLVGDANTISNQINTDLSLLGIEVKLLSKTSDMASPDQLDSKIDSIVFNTNYPNEYVRGDLGGTIMVNDTAFGDSLSVVPFASSLAKEQRSFFSTTSLRGPSDYNRFIVGGKLSVPSTYKTYPTDIDVISSFDNTIYDTYGRITAGNRYTTSVELANAYKTVLHRNIDTIILVSGEKYQDALYSNLATRNNHSAILLTQGDHLNEYTRKYIKDNNIKNIIIIGGELTISKNVENELKSIK